MDAANSRRLEERAWGIIDKVPAMVSSEVLNTELRFDPSAVETLFTNKLNILQTSGAPLTSDTVHFKQDHPDADIQFIRILNDVAARTREHTLPRVFVALYTKNIVKVESLSLAAIGSTQKALTPKMSILYFSAYSHTCGRLPVHALTVAKLHMPTTAKELQQWAPTLPSIFPWRNAILSQFLVTPTVFFHSLLLLFYTHCKRSTLVHSKKYVTLLVDNFFS